MNSRECGILQKLVSDLDGTRLLYTKLGPLLAGPRLIYLVGLTILLHEEIADDLVREMSTLSGQTLRRGAIAPGRLCAYLEPVLASAGLDVDLRCLNAVARHETRVVQRFAMTLDEVEGLPQTIYREQDHLAHVLLRIESLTQELDRPRSALHAMRLWSRSDPLRDADHERRQG